MGVGKPRETELNEKRNEERKCSTSEGLMILIAPVRRP
jgi:hypothetical protein